MHPDQTGNDQLDVPNVLADAVQRASRCDSLQARPGQQLGDDAGRQGS
jgi:hypothetical protein